MHLETSLRRSALAALAGYPAGMGIWVAVPWLLQPFGAGSGWLPFSLVAVLSGICAILGWLLFLWPMAAGYLPWVWAHGPMWRAVLGAGVGLALAAVATWPMGDDGAVRGLPFAWLSTRQVYELSGMVCGAVSTAVLGRLQRAEG